MRSTHAFVRSVVAVPVAGNRAAGTASMRGGSNRPDHKDVLTVDAEHILLLTAIER